MVHDDHVICLLLLCFGKGRDEDTMMYSCFEACCCLFRVKALSSSTNWFSIGNNLSLLFRPLTHLGGPFFKGLFSMVLI